VSLSMLVPSASRADGVRLTNGDIIRGKVQSLDGRQLVIASENFGEMTIPRDKVAMIGLGDTPLTTAASPPRDPAAATPPDPQVEQQIGRLLEQALSGDLGGLQGMRGNVDQTRRGLKELQSELGPGPGADALDGYIRMFEMFGGMADAVGKPSEGKESAGSKKGSDPLRRGNKSNQIGSPSKGSEP
jgi:hypothetical protein